MVKIKSMLNKNVMKLLCDLQRLLWNVPVHFFADWDRVVSKSNNKTSASNSRLANNTGAAVDGGQ